MTLNTLPISSQQAADTLYEAWKLQKETGFKSAYMLWGAPGIGKSQIVQQLADKIGAKLYDIRLTTIEAQDLTGLPYYNHETKQTVHYRPEILPNSDEPAVLFLDELSSAQPHIQPTVYGLLQERRVGLHEIPDNTIIIAAGNQVTDGAVAYEMGTAIADRLIHLHVTANATDWIKHFAVPRNLHPSVIAFIKVFPQHFHTIERSMEQENMIACTPRSWERVSHIMKANMDPHIQRLMISGIVGQAVASEFFVVASDISVMVKIDEMLAKKERTDRARMVPTQMHGMVAMIYGMVAALDKKTMTPIMEIFIDMLDTKAFIAGRSPQDQVALRKLPISEMAGFGVDQAFSKIMAEGLDDQLIASGIYDEYMQARESQSLAIKA